MDDSARAATASATSGSSGAAGRDSEAVLSPVERIMREARGLSEQRLALPESPRTLPQLLLLLASIGIIFACMMAAKGPMAPYGDVWQRLFYLPVFVAGLLFGFRVSVAVALLAAVLSMVQIKYSHGGDFLGMNLVRTIEVGVMVLVGALTGYLSTMVRREKEIAERSQQLLGEAAERLLNTSRELASTLDELSEQAVERVALHEQLARADRLVALGTLTAGLAHEVRNPLGAIRGTAEILSSRVEGDSVSEEFTRLLLKETDRLNEVLENFLRFVRGSRAKGEACDLVPILHELLALLDREFRKAKVTLRNRITHDSLRVSLPASSARQILINLLLNATQILAEHEGERIIEISACLRGLEGCEDSEDGKVRIYVADSGPGVSERRKEEIFDPFFTSRRGGTGLGLPIAARLASDAHGSLTLIPRDPKRLGGATFELIVRGGGHDDMPTPPPSDVISGVQDDAETEVAPAQQ